MTRGPAWVRVLRGGEEESRHRVDGVVVGLPEDGEGRFGEVDRLAYWRSSFKPFQALPLVEDGVMERLGMSREQLAVVCASHAGTPTHVEHVRALLARLERGEDELACGPHEPFDEEAARSLTRQGIPFGRVHNNCSGKHAGMLALAAHHGWGTSGYHRPDHPVQVRIRESMARWVDVAPDELAWGTDGCAVPTPYLSLRQMARAYARLCRAAGAGEPAPREVVSAMTERPELVAGPGRLSTRLMEATRGRLLAKEGAEGVLCLGSPAGGWGLALKVADGSRRAVGPAAVGALDRLGLLDGDEREALDAVAAPPLRNTRDEVVGGLEAEVPARVVRVAGRV